MDAAGSVAADVDVDAYELIRRRLETFSADLFARAQKLNEERVAVFGGAQMELRGSARIRTENNCIPRDIAHVGGLLLFGYNVFIGLKTETRVEDVFSLHAVEDSEQGVSFRPLPPAGTFLADTQFQRDFKELYSYYKDSRLTHLRTLGGKLLAVFATGRKASDIKVFRWNIAPDGEVAYIDNRGERDNRFPPSHSFEWQKTSRDHHVSGASPHISIDDEIFVDTIGGNLTVKIENNTRNGLGIYDEPVEDDKQTLADADVLYACVGQLILIKIRPYGEDDWRYLVFNRRDQSVRRHDAIGGACIELPEDHGIIFPGGFYLVDGQSRVLDEGLGELTFKRMIRSPNGEDVLYVFHNMEEGRMLLLSYNVISKSLQNPIECHGYSFFEDGAMVVFRFDGEEATRVHTMQIWATGYTSDEFAAGQPAETGVFGRIGNADLVRGISDAFSIHRVVAEATPSVRVYEDLIRASNRMRDAYHWLHEADAGEFGPVLIQIQDTAERILGEFEKVESLKQQALEAFTDVENEQRSAVSALRPDSWHTVGEFVSALTNLNRVRGRLISLREIRYMNLIRVDELEAETKDRFESLGVKTVEFLAGAGAMAPFFQTIDEQDAAIEAVTRRIDLQAVGGRLDELGEALDLLNQVLAGIAIDDTNLRTNIIERISEVYARLNRARAGLDLKRRSLGKAESKAEFGAQFLLFTQTVTSALGLANTPERADEQLTRLLVQLEELEGRFGEFDDYLEDLGVKREEVYSAFESRKQSLVEARQRRARRLTNAAGRMLEGIERRSAGFEDPDALNAYFAADPMVTKIRDIVAALRELDDAVAADDLDSKLKAVRDQSGRVLRDRKDMFEGADVIRLGKHRFSVVTQNPDLTILPSADGLILQLTGTDYLQYLDTTELKTFQPYWSQELVSENADVYRAEYLAATMLRDARAGAAGLSLAGLREAALDPDTLLTTIRKFATERFEEGYERGVHDADAVLILAKLLELDAQAGLLRNGPRSRALALLFVSTCDHELTTRWGGIAGSLGTMSRMFASAPRESGFTAEVAGELEAFALAQRYPVDAVDVRLAAEYVVDCLAHEPRQFVISGDSRALADQLLNLLADTGVRSGFEADLAALKSRPGEQLRLAEAWLGGFLGHKKIAPPRFAAETAVLLLEPTNLNLVVSSAPTALAVDGLLGEHANINDRKMDLVIDEFLRRLTDYSDRAVPDFRAYRRLRHEVLEREREMLRLEEYKPKPLTSFVRNMLIDEVYLPIIGDNLAKQMGALGAAKRTDLMGILLLISPPGYGKTTLMEYVASRLGLIFMKINCPSIGHDVSSVDPASAANATARQELEKLNLAFEMGNNVMIYLDDIQHTNPEFLQKFISMGDAQRKIEGVWRGRTRTYDLRGKRVCLVMAGNPYTESGEAFRIPDMLANRADIYNLGDILGGREQAFAMSYLENSLTSNAVLAPLANRDLADLYRFVRVARGESVSSGDFSHDYSATERAEMVEVLKRLIRIQEVVLGVNQAYIASASQADAYRTEPPFKLQGSYRNMNKMAEKVVAVMDEAELEQLIDDHYQGEAQTLTTGAEENLLKLKEIRGVLEAEETQRWADIRNTFRRTLEQGDSETDPATRVVGQLVGIGQQLQGVQDSIEAAAGAGGDQRSLELQTLQEWLAGFDRALEQMQLNVQVVNKPVPGMQVLLTQLVDAYDQTLLPLLKSLHHKLSLDESIWRTVSETAERLRSLDQRLLERGNSSTHRVAPLKKAKTRKKTQDPN